MVKFGIYIDASFIVVHIVSFYRSTVKILLKYKFNACRQMVDVKLCVASTSIQRYLCDKGLPSMQNPKIQFYR